MTKVTSVQDPESDKNTDNKSSQKKIKAQRATSKRCLLILADNLLANFCATLGTVAKYHISGAKKHSSEAIFIQKQKHYFGIAQSTNIGGNF